MTTVPRRASPATTRAQSSPPTASDTGYLVVNHPTVRDRSTWGASSSWRPWPSTSMTIGAPPPPTNSATAKANAINRISCTPA
ncbi:hypothetical protein A5655_12450 [Mycobacterium sp. 1081908.1]|nr:hypothetical protein A5655_12450 [Mycobacterium sp. 1081908.1]